MSWRDRLWAREKPPHHFHREANLREIREMIAETESHAPGFSILHFSMVMKRRYGLRQLPTLRFCRNVLIRSGLASFDGEKWSVNS